jgi:hypothetical protein
MIQGKSSTVGRQLEALWTSGSLTGKSDAQLLSRFAAARDAASESAFRELVHRHGSMVMGVCRQILRHPHDADDAFQATFLVLVRKADSIRVAASLFARPGERGPSPRAIAPLRSRAWKTPWATLPATPATLTCGPCYMKS